MGRPVTGFYVRQTPCDGNCSSSNLIGWPYLISTFTKVAGEEAVHLPQTFDGWFHKFDGADMPIANELHGKASSEMDAGMVTWRKSLTAWWFMSRDDICKMNLDWIIIC